MPTTFAETQDKSLTECSISKDSIVIKKSWATRGGIDRCESL